MTVTNRLAPPALAVTVRACAKVALSVTFAAPEASVVTLVGAKLSLPIEEDRVTACPPTGLPKASRTDAVSVTLAPAATTLGAATSWEAVALGAPAAKET